MGSGHSTYCCSYETYLMRVALNISHTTLLVHGVVEKVYQMGARSRQEWSQRPEAMKQCCNNPCGGYGIGISTIRGGMTITVFLSGIAQQALPEFPKSIRPSTDVWGHPCSRSRRIPVPAVPPAAASEPAWECTWGSVQVALSDTRPLLYRTPAPRRLRSRLWLYSTVRNVVGVSRRGSTFEWKVERTSRDKMAAPWYPSTYKHAGRCWVDFWLFVFVLACWISWIRAVELQDSCDRAVRAL